LLDKAALSAMALNLAQTTARWTSLVVSETTQCASPVSGLAARYQTGNGHLTL